MRLDLIISKKSLKPNRDGAREEIEGGFTIVPCRQQVKWSESQKVDPQKIFANHAHLFRLKCDHALKTHQTSKC